MFKRLATVLFTAMTSISALAGQPLTLPIVAVIDGDTIRTHLPLPPPLDVVSVRILNIDTGETGHRSQCQRERALGRMATDEVHRIAADATTMSVTELKWDKFGGRINGVVHINGINVGEHLISTGLAQRYTGKGSKPDWCAHK